MHNSISRKSVIQALKTEPLKRGDWVDTQSFRRGYKDCNVCAVGAILRKAGVENSFIGDIARSLTKMLGVSFQKTKAGVNADIQGALEDKNYLGALSMKFEDQGGDRVTKRQRQSLIAFVRKHFPKRISLK